MLVHHIYNIIMHTIGIRERWYGDGVHIGEQCARQTWWSAWELQEREGRGDKKKGRAVEKRRRGKENITYYNIPSKNNYYDTSNYSTPFTDLYMWKVVPNSIQ